MLKTYDFHSFIQRPHFSQIAKNDFRVKHPFINQEFHMMIGEFDKCAERKQSFSFFNVKELVLKSGTNVLRYLVYEL